MATIKKSIDFARELVHKILLTGEQAVDATAGNGHDTVFLASLVGNSGKVWAFDIQKEAIRNTEERLRKTNLRRRVNLIQEGHEKMAKHVDGPVGAIMFNLGYLPGGEHSITTQPATTIAAVRSGLNLLRSGGIITIVVYTGHPGGEVESAQLNGFCSTLPQENYQVLIYNFINQHNYPPYLLAIEKG